MYANDWGILTIYLSTSFYVNADEFDKAAN